MNVNTQSNLIIVTVLCIILVSCTHFRLDEFEGTLTVNRLGRVEDATIVVLRFVSESNADMNVPDLVHWTELFAEGLRRSNIFGQVLVQRDGGEIEDADYLIEGKVTKFAFTKHWVPTFFPVHLGASFFSLGAYTFMGGATTMTSIEFETHINLKDAKSREIVERLTELYEYKGTLNVYSESALSPYENPSLVFSRVINSVARRMAAVLRHM